MRILATLLVFLWSLSSMAAEESLRAKMLGFETYTIGGSMEPTIHPGEVIYVDTRAFGNAAPGRGNIVAFRPNELQGGVFVMRVVAIANDTCEIRDGQLFVNGEEVGEPYLNPKLVQTPYARRLQKIFVPPGTVFVLGDNRDNSNDSRRLGPVPIAHVVGHATMIVDLTQLKEVRQLH
jgi:signal peptidase I